MAWSDIQWGNAAEWAAAVFSSGAVVVALFALRSERQDRKQAERELARERHRQAQIVARRVIAMHQPMGNGVRLIRHSFTVHNRTEDAISDVTVHVPELGCEMQRRPEITAGAGLLFEFAHRDGAERVNERNAVIEWTDHDGNRWRRYDGRVELIA